MKTAWIKSPRFDLIWILFPAILPCLLVVLFSDYFLSGNAGANSFNWVLLVMFIDVGHVYSTLYRTYFSREGLVKYNHLLKIIPFICFVVGVMLYSLGYMAFWRCMAYMAVFHFIRQQYGFLRIYSRNEELPRIYKNIHTITIYSVTIIPVLIWHFMGARNFNWFVENDFIYFNYAPMAVVCKVLLALIILTYGLSEYILFKNHGIFNLPRLLLVAGTALSWYMGIVVYNGDLIFTMLNVVAHGIPYIALIWVTEKSKTQTGNFAAIRHVFSAYGIFIFAAILLVLAYFEEGLWDALVWREQETVFAPFYFLQQIQNQKALAFLVPLLSLPQVVHYVLDGFIWKMRDKNNVV